MSHSEWPCPREIFCFPRYECEWPLAWRGVPQVTCEWIKKLDAYAFKNKKKSSVGVELRAGGDPHRSEKPGWSASDMRQWPKQKKHKHPVSPTGVLLLVFLDLFKVSKIIFDLFKVSKITTKFLTCSKSAKILRSSHPKEQPSQEQSSHYQKLSLLLRPLKLL